MGQLAAMLDERVRLVAVKMTPANNGLVNPVAKIKQCLKGIRCRLFVDAPQVVGQLPVDVRALGADVLTFDACKWLRGPRGIGVLYVAKDLLAEMTPPIIGDQEGLDPIHAR